MRTFVTNNHRLDQRNPFARVGSWVFSFWDIVNFFTFYFGARTLGPGRADFATSLLRCIWTSFKMRFFACCILKFTFSPKITLLLFLYFRISSRIWEFIDSIVYCCSNLFDIYYMFIRTILSSWTPFRCVKLITCLLVLITRWNYEVIIFIINLIMCKSTCCNVRAVGSISAWLIETTRRR